MVKEEYERVMDALNWVMDGQPLTTPEERAFYEGRDWWDLEPVPDLELAA